MIVGTVGAGRIGLAVLRRLKAFDVKLHYTDRHRLPESVEKELNLTYHPNAESLVSVCDVVTINAPLHPETEHLFNDALIEKMKRGAYIVNTARGKICDRDAIVRALESGQLAGYAGDVWFPQPAAEGPSLADHASSRHDAAHLRHKSFRPGPLRRRRTRDPGMLVRETAPPRGIPHCERGEVGRSGRAFVQSGQCDWWFGRSGALQALAAAKPSPRLRLRSRTGLCFSLLPIRNNVIGSLVTDPAEHRPFLLCRTAVPYRICLGGCMCFSTIARATTASLAVGSLWLLGSCESDRAVDPAATTDLEAHFGRHDRVLFANRSVTPALVKNIMPGVRVYTLLSSDDTLSRTPGFVFGGSADGSGLLRNRDKTFTLLVNNEDNFSVSRITLDRTFRPVAGEYAVNSDNGLSRLCSATLVTPEVHGFGPLFLTAGESSVESMSRALNPFGTANSSQAVTAFGRWSAENTVPLPRTAYRGKTVVLIGDDDSGPFGGQLALYVSDRVGDLEQGQLYVMTRTDANTREMDMKPGKAYPVTFKQIPNQQTLTGAQLNEQAQALHAIVFGRVEDIDYRRERGEGREVYFNVTGQTNTGVNADYSRSKYGRVYRLTLDRKTPTKGTLEVVLDGDDRAGPARTFQNPDNIVATERYLYISEDPNGYGDEMHDAYLYQYDLLTKKLRVVFELDHRRDQADAAKYNVGGPSGSGTWESSGMIDVSEQTGEPGTFLIGVQAHTWLGDRYRNPDGGTLRAQESQASQLLVLRGLPR